MSDVIRYEPKKPVGNVGTLRALLTQSEQTIREVLPKHMDADRLTKLMLLAATKTPKLLQCTQESIYQAVMTSAELGLDISGTMGEAYILPYGNVATFQLGYKGMVKLARNSGEIARIEAEVVYSNDKFEYRKGTVPLIDFRPSLTGSRGEPVGAYALIQYQSGGVETDFMGLDEIEKVRRVSKAGNSGPWKDWWDEMAKKTVLRRLLKTATLSSEKVARAVEADNAGYDLKRVSVTAEATDLNRSLGLIEDATEEITDTEDGA